MTTEPRPRRLMALLIGASIVTIGILALLVTIFERRQEARTPFFQVVQLTDSTEDPAVWGRNYPLQYESYLRTVDQQRTRFGGSEAAPRTPSNADPRSVVAQSRLDEDPRLRTLWAGYAFSIDFREERGHAFMLDDQTYTGRQAVQQPGTCMHCHASVYQPYKRLGDGDLIRGFERMNQMPYQEARTHVTHPVTCLDCHDPATMRLRVTRPGFIEGWRALKASQGVLEYDVNRDATRQEMRSFVCGQCHVEYYFRGSEKRLTYPWYRGLKVDQIYAHYDSVGFRDWVHADAGTSVLKAQHPEFEMWNQGIHARANVACADCHMPFQRVGAQKVSDHQVRSPLLNVDASCRTCHPVAAAELRARAERIQENTYRLRDQAMDAVTALIADLKAARAAGLDSAGLAPARALHRRAQFYLDFIEAENSMGFHAPQEAARILGEAIDYARQGQIAVRDPSFTPRLPAPAGN